jgi:parvulin-like peptidyl-prolyl isomerase
MLVLAEPANMNNKARFERIEADLTEVAMILRNFSRSSKQQASALDALQQSQERTQLMLEEIAERHASLEVTVKEIAELVRGLAQGPTNGRKHNK